MKLFEACLQEGYRENALGASWRESRRGNALFLWFEHSRGIRDWIHNLNFAIAPYREMDPEWNCHAGFLRVWKSIKNEVDILIRDPDVESVTITGYSHGAALALLCHEYVWYQRPDLRQRLFGVGFGCPRVLYGCVNESLALRWEHFYVVRNLDDIVTHLPPRALGFCHVGTLIEIGENGLYSPIDAHRPESYRKELKKAEE